MLSRRCHFCWPWQGIRAKSGCETLVCWHLSISAKTASCRPSVESFKATPISLDSSWIHLSQRSTRRALGWTPPATLY